MQPTVTIDLEDYELYRKSYEVVQQQGKVLYLTSFNDGNMPYSTVRTTNEVLSEMAEQVNELNHNLKMITCDNEILRNQIGSLKIKISEYEISAELNNHTPKKWYQFWK